MNGLSDNVEAVFPLSPTQEGMLYHTLHTPDSGVYIGQHTIKLEAVDSIILRRAWQLISNRHMALRCVFMWEALSRSVQLVYKQRDIDWREIDLRDSPDKLQTLLNADIKEEFDVSSQPPCRISLFRLSDNRHLMVWTRHHLVVDGWSAHIVLQQLQEAYTALVSKGEWRPTGTPEFSAYMTWLQRQDNAISADYWRNLLSHSEANPGLESMRSSNRGSKHSRRIEQYLSLDESAQLAQAARAKRLTLSTMLHGAWAAVLFAINDSSSLLFGSTVSGRPADLPHHESIVGNFINTIPVQVFSTDDNSLSIWLQALQKQLLQSAAHGHLANRQILQAADIPAGTPLFDSIVVFMNYPRIANTESALNFVHENYIEHSHYPVAVLAIPGDELQLIIIHDTDQIPPHKADQLLEMLAERLRSLTSDLSESTEHFFTGARPQVSALETVPLAVKPVNVIARFEHSVKTCGSVPAVSDGQRELTYTELNAAVQNMAQSLSKAGVKKGDRVVLTMPCSIEGLISIWAVMFCGAAYVPLATSTPTARIDSLFTQVKARLLIAPAPIPGFDPVFVFDSINTQAPEFQRADVEAAMIAYVIFTSGSTGEPKAVSISHGNLAHSLAARLQFYGEQSHIYAMMSPFAFDSSVAGIFWTAATGGCLVLVKDNILTDPGRLLDYLSAMKISALLTLPSVYRAMLDMLTPSFKQHFRLAIVAGDACHQEIHRLHNQQLPETTLVNEYGPTEATVWCCAQRFKHAPADDLSEPYLPIGKAIAGVELHVLDKSLRPVPQGVIGELHIGGPVVAQSEKQSDLYPTGDLVEVDLAGTLLFRGRKDAQIKIRGHRVDPAEVEAIMQSHPDIIESAVIGFSRSVDSSVNNLNAALATLPLAEALDILAVIETEY